jgi:hypothetical protein
MKSASSLRDPSSRDVRNRLEEDGARNLVRAALAQNRRTSMARALAPAGTTHATSAASLRVRRARTRTSATRHGLKDVFHFLGLHLSSRNVDERGDAALEDEAATRVKGTVVSRQSPSANRRRPRGRVLEPRRFGRRPAQPSGTSRSGRA